MVNYLTLLLFYVFLFFIGRGSAIVLSKFNIIQLKNFDENEKLFFIPLNNFYPIIGLFLIGNLSIISNFFISLNLIYKISIFSILMFANIFKESQFKIKFQEKFLLFVTLPLLSVSNYNTGLSYDAGLYHLNYQNWLQEEKIVLGLSNFHSRFGYSSIYDFISTNFWYKENFLVIHMLNLIFISFFFIAIHQIYSGTNLMQIKIGIMGVLLYGFLDNFGYSGGKNGFIEIEGVTKYDTPFGIIYFLTLLFISIFFYQKKISNIEISIILIFAIFSFQMRVSGALLFIPLIFLLIKSKKLQSLKQNKILILFGIFNILKNMLTTGCLYFPIEFTCFNSLSWYQNGYALTERKSISYSLRAYDYGDSFYDWFEIWINKYDYNLPTLKNFLVAFIFINLLKIILSDKVKVSLISSLFLMFNLFVLAYWILSAPSFRYGIGFFVSLVYFGTFFEVKSLKYKNLISHKNFIFLLFFTIILLPRSTNYQNLVRNPFEVTSISPLTIEYIKKVEGFGYSPLQDNEVCWINKFCSPKYSSMTQLKENKFGYLYFVIDE